MKLRRTLPPTVMAQMRRDGATLAEIAAIAHIGKERVRQLVNLVRRRGSRASHRFDPRAFVRSPR